MEEEKELHLGIMTGQEIAEWFGINHKSYTNSRKKKLEILKDFADFEEIHGAVNIYNIKIPTYSKKSDRIKEIVRIHFFEVWHKSHYDTAARAAAQLYKSNKEIQKLCKNCKTFQHYFNEVRKEFFGRVAINEVGTKGTCHYEIIESNDWNEAVLLSEEKKKLQQEITKKWYVNKQEPYLYESLMKHEISQQEFDEAMAEWNSPEARNDRYWGWHDEMIEKLEQFEKVTKLEVCAWDEEE